MKRLVCLGFLFSISLACESENGGGVTDTNTNWLDACDSDESCGGGGLSCLCNVCTRACDEASACRDLADGAECRDPVDCSVRVCLASDADSGEDDDVTTEDDASSADDDTFAGDDDVVSDDDAFPTDDDVESDDDALPSDDDVSASDDDALPSDDDVSASDDDVVPGDDDGGSPPTGSAGQAGSANGGASSTGGGGAGGRAGGAGESPVATAGEGGEAGATSATGGSGGDTGSGEDGGAACHEPADVCSVTVDGDVQLDEPCCNALACTACRHDGRTVTCSCEDPSTSCSDVCTTHQPSSWCDPEAGWVDDTTPVEWVCDSGGQLMEDLDQNCVMLPTGAARWCCPQDFRATCE